MREGVIMGVIGDWEDTTGYNGIHTIVLASTMHTRELCILLSYSSMHRECILARVVLSSRT